MGTDGWIHGWMDTWMDGYMDRWMDRWAAQLGWEMVRIKKNNTSEVPKLVAQRPGLCANTMVVDG